MSKVVFFNVPAHGHINPTLAVVRELIQRGEKVIYYATEAFRPKIERTGAVFCAYRGVPDYDLAGFSGNFIRLAALLMEATQSAMPALLESIEATQPDYIIHDVLCVWGKLLSQITGIPAVASTCLFAFTPATTSSSFGFVLNLARMVSTSLPSLVRFGRAGRALARTYGVRPPSHIEALGNHEALNIVYTSRAFQPNSDALGDDYKFVGPPIAPRDDATDFPFDRLSGGPVIYISMGTIFNERADFYRACFDAFAGGEHRVVMSVGDKIAADGLGVAPSNFIVRNFVPQLQVLQHADLFITHGGMNSVHEGMYYGVPLVVIPQMAEQGLVAEQVVRVGAGVRMDAVRITPGALRAAAARVLADPAFRERSAQIGQTLRAAGGYIRAADEIFAFKAAHNL
ncbi:MAG: glycosyl transferase family 1 [Anaerolineae bacterium]|nr:glycosyl transferase family 1 [Anaerolineae bacterium]